LTGEKEVNNLFIELDKNLEEGRELVLARIIKQVGSAPRGVGAKCIVFGDGSIIGTIGGGFLEYQVQEEAKKILEEGKSSIINFQLTGEEVAESEMLCGGIVDVFLEPVFPENTIARKIFKKIKELILDGREGLLLTLVSEGIRCKDETCSALVQEDGTLTGNIGSILDDEKQRFQSLFEVRKPELIESEEGGSLIFAEPVRSDDVLYLFGAGHVSTFVASLAKRVGFYVVVIDDREEFANKYRFPNADELIVSPFLKAFNQITLNSSTYIAIITRGHIHDRVVLKEAIQANPLYIGMIGSRRKRKLIYESLMEDGITNERLNQVHSPIGLDIGAETPEEIAVSIVAELIQKRASSKGKKVTVHRRDAEGAEG